MTVDELWRAIDAERVGVADLLDDLSADEWESPSLCDGWRVRDVAAHLTLAHMGVGPALVGLVRAGGSPDRMIRDTAVRRAALPVDAYAPLIRAMLGSRRHAPGVGPLEPLIDVLVHGQDVCRPLSRVRPMPPAASAAAASRVWERGWPWHPRRRFRGLRFAATDADWSRGEGALVTGPAGAVLLALTGRDVALSELEGEGLPRLRAVLVGATAPGR